MRVEPCHCVSSAHTTCTHPHSVLQVWFSKYKPEDGNILKIILCFYSKWNSCARSFSLLGKRSASGFLARQRHASNLSYPGLGKANRQHLQAWKMGSTGGKLLRLHSLTTTCSLVEEVELSPSFPTMTYYPWKNSHMNVHSHLHTNTHFPDWFEQHFFFSLRAASYCQRKREKWCSPLACFPCLSQHAETDPQERVCFQTMNFHLLKKLLHHGDSAGEVAVFIQNLPSLLGGLSIVPPYKNLSDNCFSSSTEMQRSPLGASCCVCLCTVFPTTVTLLPPQSFLFFYFLPCLVTCGNEVCRDQT